ncbi:MAG TPA: S26 family signal peptidase, partial [Methanomassiliicoccales archaeon]|nr:S26 family signal peptidase [Methanomassiliicoccales archaeon]
MRVHLAVSSATKRALAVINRFKVIIIAVAIVVLIIASLMVYSGSWPPLVVVESASMQHSDTTSYIGVIDTGDLVIQKRISNMNEVTPYLNAYASAYAVHFAAGSEYMTYGEYGDVVIYRPVGSTTTTPIIHRALCLVYFNGTGHSFDVPVLKDLPPTMWSVSSGAKTWYDLKSTVTLNGIGYNNVSVNINFAAILSSYDFYVSQHPGFTLNSGLITLGDNNHGQIDQGPSQKTWSPVKLEWIDGVARGEIPWFGLLKLWISGPAPTSVPQNSVTDLWVAIGLIIGVPILIDVVGYVLERKGIDFWAGVRTRLHISKKGTDPSKTET